MTIQKNISFVPALVPESILEGDNDNGSNINNAEESFMRVALFVLGNMQTFSLMTFYQLLSYKADAINNADIQMLFKVWTKEMTLRKRIIPVNGAYEEIVYQVL